MSPTLKDGSTLSTSSSENTERLAIGAPPSGEGGSAQPVALEVPVTVNGARAVEGSQKREPFSESTNTVLVLVRGAVIRLSSPVAAGQLLFLTNEKTKKEVVCTVVKSKNYGSASGYVELEFTEPVLGFWGMRFPGERHGGAVGAPAASARKYEVAPVAPVESKGSPAFEENLPVVSATVNGAEAEQEFKTEIKADLRPSSKADFLAPSQASSGGLKQEANRLQEQLSALLFAEQRDSDTNPANAALPTSQAEPRDAAAKIFEPAKEEPAGKKSVTVTAPKANESAWPLGAAKTTPPAGSSFDEEVVKIPSWLEPLARNEGVPAQPKGEPTSEFVAQEDWQGLAAREPASSSKQAETVTRSVSAPAKRPPEPALFGNTLLGETDKGGLSRPGKSGKGAWMAIAAVLIAGAAAGAWYFRDSLGGAVPAGETSQTSVSGAPDLSAGVPQTNLASEGASSLSGPAMPDISLPEKKSSSPKAKGETVSTLTAALPGKMQAAAITERVPRTGSSSELSRPPVKSTEIIEPESKKIVLGEVHLAKPKVGRPAKTQANSEMAPTLEVSNEVLSGDANPLSGGFADSGKQPVAPAAEVKSGGDVKPARMMSSVPPVYPALARSQHISGDVRVDALIDASGRVTTMKVVSGPPLLHQAAMDALRQWKYQAASLDGKAVPMHLTVTIQFRLQ